MLLAITRAALASAVMFMGGALIPAVGGIAMILAPTPVLHSSIGYRNAFWRSIIIALLSAGLVGIGGGVGAILTYLATAGIASAGMCYLIEKRQPFERIVGSIALDTAHRRGECDCPCGLAAGLGRAASQQSDAYDCAW